MHDFIQKKKLFLELYPKKNFHISKTCKAVGIARRTFYNWMENDEEFNLSIEELQESDVDDSEETLRILRKGIPKLNKEKEFIGWKSKPEITAVIFHLKTKGKDRGYVEEYGIKHGVIKEKYDLSKLSDEELSQIETILNKTEQKDDTE